MIKKISLTNFKSFKELKNLELKNLTIIVGKNSCGKSSILQSLLLLKQTLISSTNYPLCLEGKYLKFSNLKELSFGLPAVNKSKIGYEFEFRTGSKNKRIELSFKTKGKKGNYDIIVDEFNEIIDKETKIKHNIISKRKVKDFLKNKLNFPKDELNKISSYDIKFDRFLPDKVEISFKTDGIENRKIILPMVFFSGASEDIYSELNNIITNIRYLSPVRAIPERAYVHYSQDVSELNENGSNAAHILWAKQNSKVNWKGKSLLLKEAVNECIRCMGLEQFVTPERVGEILYKVGIQVKSSNKHVSLTDVGFGYSQIIPVILMGLLNDKSNLMLLEQPEIHLHPSSAANLADLFLNFIKDDKQFLIETHSQELINRLRLRVIQNPELKEKINIVFVDSGDDLGSEIKQFSIDEDGMFPEWPDGFLDESEKLAQAILEARLNKGNSYE